MSDADTSNEADAADRDTRTAAPRPGTTHPHLARERALKVLFAADVRGVDPRSLLDELATHPADLELLDELEPDEEQVAGDEELQLELTRRRRLPLDDYTRALVEGVAAHRPSIDELLGEVADHWAVRRMPSVDRNLLRLAIYELAEQDTPHPIVMDEAVSLAIAFAGEKARSFVNGVLETVRQRIVAGEVNLVETPVAEVAPEPEPTPDSEIETDADDAPEDAAAVVDEAAHEAYDLALDLLGDDDVDLSAYVGDVTEGDDADLSAYADDVTEGDDWAVPADDWDASDDDDVDVLDDDPGVLDDADDLEADTRFEDDTDEELADEFDGANLRDEDEALW